EYDPIRVAMALAVMLGFLSHLALDEVCSVDLAGARVNRAFGTAMKFWAPSAWSTLGMYALLAYLAWRVIDRWPDDPAALVVRVPAPEQSWLEGVGVGLPIPDEGPDWGG